MVPPAGSPLRAIAIVPARLSSTRLPRKMLLRDTGRYLFEHTVRNIARSPRIDRVLLATDSDEIVTAAAEVGIEAVMTSAAHRSGTDRVHEAAEILSARGEGPWDVIVNVQGDEPDLPGVDVETLIDAFADPAVELATLYAAVESEREALDPSVVKVVRDAAGNALYFSRAPIPSLDHPSRPSSLEDGLRALRRHIGVYAFRPDALDRFCSLAPGTLEQAESLEQLRWIEAGRPLRVVEASQTTVGIDTPEHYALFVERHQSPNSVETNTP
jgi:3-deoxy-D-manno-octulosonate cytidylyltransferase